MYKRLLKRLARHAGYEIRKISPLPAGQDWIVDLQRLFAGRTAPVLFDVGANVGVIARRLAEFFPAPAQIFAFEPSAATHLQLAAALASHPHVQAHRFALSETEGNFRLYHGINSQLSRLAPAGALGDGTTEDVDVTTIDAAARRFRLARIDLIKTDTEGFDLSVLRGARGLFERGAISAVLSEATFDEQSDWHTRFDDLRAFLTPLGFCLHGIYDSERWGSHLKYGNVLFVRTAEFPATG